MDPQADSRIAKLPQELIDRIVDFLPTVTLGHVRLTCKLMEHHLFTYFSKHYFTKKQFMVTEASLQALVDISEHPALSPCLKHLIIGLDHYVFWSRALAPALDYTVFIQRKGAAESQRRMFTTGRAVSLLARALSNLRNLQTLDIRDFNSQTRVRDSETGSGAWRSWGAPTLEAQGHELAMSDGNNTTNTDDYFHNRVFQAVLGAMANSSGRPKALMVILRHRIRGLNDCAFGLDQWMEESIAPALESLQTLHLDVLLDNQTHTFITDAQPFQDIFDMSNTRIRHFLSRTRNVTSLRLNFQNTPTQLSFRLINWLSTLPGTDPVANRLPWISPCDLETPPPWDEYNPAPVALPLTQLDLGAAHISTSTLRKLFRKFHQLKGLSFFNVTLYPSSLQSGSRSRVNLWSDMFRELSADLPPNLKSLNLRRLKQADTENLNISSLFVKFDEQPSKEVAVSKKSLEQLAEATTVDWPVIRSNNYSGEDSENEDEDDDGYGDGNDDLI
ncbi:putative f-box domain containing protein [Lasiodiplodia theobromae]|uniref:F-box domain containing protein n=1 Tax=Lasiodiplodia theobromae TaxID=45133 RepID=UPI0015C3C78A|nr:F-box domain containing protein [Lasiodiplodia theobromae]KAF4546696.1 F-box domain containing protein [Lasiodiplodia theobromae]KAF9632104.1 putative f-box domain containing protein [Lasiodiplodia theobromae]